MAWSVALLNLSYSSENFLPAYANTLHKLLDPSIRGAVTVSRTFLNVNSY